MSYETVRYGTIETTQPDGPPEIISVTEVTRIRRRQRTSSVLGGICCCLFILLVVVALLYVGFMLFMFMAYDCTGIVRPPVFGRPTWANFKNETFHVGFDLTAGYGTASLVFDNGTIIDVGRVEGTDEYNEVLARYALETSRRPTPPYYNCSAEWADLPRQWRRYFNKMANKPASSDVAALAAVLGPLKDKVNEFLGDLGLVKMAFIVVPRLPGIYNEELLDAGHAVGIQMMTLPDYMFQSGDAAQWPVTELNAAFVGNGFATPGLQDPDLWDGNVYSVLFTRHALTAHVLPLGGDGTHFYAASGIANFSLGSAASYGAPHYYWREVRWALRDALKAYGYRGQNIGRVVSYGESAHYPTFQTILHEEVLANQKDEEGKGDPVFRSEHEVYAGARGAAMFGKLCTRIPWSPERCFPDLTPRMQGW